MNCLEIQTWAVGFCSNYFGKARRGARGKAASCHRSPGRSYGFERRKNMRPVGVVSVTVRFVPIVVTVPM